jgi:hypothetical protein
MPGMADCWSAIWFSPVGQLLPVGLPLVQGGLFWKLGVELSPEQTQLVCANAKGNMVTATMATTRRMIFIIIVVLFFQSAGDFFEIVIIWK